MVQKTYYKTYRTLPDPPYITLTNEYAGTNTFTLKKNGTPASTDLSYSTDNGATWTQFDLTQTTNTVSISQGGNIKLRSTTGFNSNVERNNFNIYMANIFSISGHFATLIDYTQWDSVTSLGDYALYEMCNQQYVKDVNLDFSGITSIGKYSFFNTFSNCSLLDNVILNLPDLTTNVNGLFRETFYRSKIKTLNLDIRSIPYLADRFFQSFCERCDSLTTANIDMRSVTTISGSDVCTSWFSGCSNLTTIPDLSNIVSVSGSLDNAFAYTKITSIDLSNITAVYNSNTFSNTFKNCSNLNYVKTPNISTWDTSKFPNWLQGTAATGLVKKPAALTIPTDSDSGVPTGWTVENY